MNRRCFTPFLLLLLIFFSACKDEGAKPGGEVKKASPEKVLRLGLVPEINIFKQRKRYRPLVDYLSAQAGATIEMKIMASYGKVAHAFKEGILEMAFVGSLDYVLINAFAGGEVVARPKWKDGRSNYKGYIFTRRGSGITSDFSTWKGKKMAMVHPFTTAGDIFPRAYLAARAVPDLQGFFGETVYYGSHDASMKAVYSGKADIGCGKDLVFDRLVRNDPKFGDAMTVLAESLPVPSNGLVLSKSVDGEMKKRLKAALLGLHESPEGKGVFQTFEAERFIETADSDYDVVRKMLEKAKIDNAQLFNGYVEKNGL